MRDLTGKYRLGAVSFLNTIPLIDWFQHSGPDKVVVHRALPSQLSQLLAADEVDVALLPVVEIFRGKSGGMLWGTGIAGEGPVDSVKLFANGPWQDLDRIIADRGSRSSVALLKILYMELAGRCPDFQEAEPRAGDSPAPGQGILVIGDRCFEIERVLEQKSLAGIEGHDLGSTWNQLTGLPFVFATWALSPRFEQKHGQEGVAEIKALLQASRDHGLQNLSALASKAAREGYLGIRGEATAEAIDYYFRRSLRYELGEKERAGLIRFQELCREHGLVVDSPRLKIL